MKLLSSLSIRKLLYNKRFTIPFSLFMAFAIWLTITIDQKPTIGRTFADVTVSINLENTFVAENKMSIIGDISEQKFTVVVRGPNYAVSPLTASDFSLYASAAEVDAPGDYKLKVMSVKNSEEYEILSINPPTVKVNFDYVETKEFTVTAVAEGATAAQGLIAEAGVVGGTEKDSITISGPRTVVNKIETVTALAKVNKTLSASETFEADIVLYDEQGEVIEPTNLSLSANKVNVTVPISKKKNVPVKVEFSNLPKGFSKESLSAKVDHPNVTIIGTPETIDKITEFTLTPIDITTVSASSSTFQVLPKLPEGVRLLDAIESFKVDVNVSGYIEKTLTVSNLKYSNVSSGLKASNGVSIKNVKIFGPRAVVNKINSSNVYAELNLTDKMA
ncbi:MAG: hypothetical protein IKY45_03695, partial [Clostridia bacterium]|nr:hypothetical protein [Clostridia bacterium]